MISKILFSYLKKLNFQYKLLISMIYKRMNLFAEFRKKFIQIIKDQNYSKFKINMVKKYINLNKIKLNCKITQRMIIQNNLN